MILFKCLIILAFLEFSCEKIEDDEDRMPRRQNFSKNKINEGRKSNFHVSKS